MDSASNAGDFPAAKLPRMSSAASLEPAEPHVQATRPPSQLVRDGADEEESQSGDFVKQDLASDPPEATTAGAQADIKEDTHLPTVDTSDDDSSVDGSDLEDVRVRQPIGLKIPHSLSLMLKYKESGPKYARAASTYVEGLEARVGVLEKDLLELQYEVGSKERPDEVKRQVLRDVPDLCR